MTPAETVHLYEFVAALYGLDGTPETYAAWHLILADTDPHAAQQATRRLCQTDTPYPPRPGQILAEISRHDGTTPPPPDAALGYYLAGQWAVHPLVTRAAHAVYWDRHTEPQRATFDFKAAYQAALDDDDLGVTRRQRHAELTGPTRLTALHRPMPPTRPSDSPSPPASIDQGDNPSPVRSAPPRAPTTPNGSSGANDPGRPATDRTATDPGTSATRVTRQKNPSPVRSTP